MHQEGLQVLPPHANTWPINCHQGQRVLGPPPLHLELLLNNQLKNLYDRWEGMAAWMKSIRVDHVRYNGGKELGKFVKYKLFFERKY